MNGIEDKEREVLIEGCDCTGECNGIKVDDKHERIASGSVLLTREDGVITGKGC